MQSDLNDLAGEKLGTLHGKIFRNVDGLVRFMRLMFLDCLPALLIGVFALTAALSAQPVLGLIMLGVVPAAVLLTMRQLQTQKSVRLKLMRDCEVIDGTVVGVMFAFDLSRPTTAYALTDAELSAVLDPLLAASQHAVVSTGPCLNE